MCQTLEEALRKVAEMKDCAPLPNLNGGLLPHWGAVEVSDRVASIGYFLNMPNGYRNGVNLEHEFVWDPIKLRFATIKTNLFVKGGSPHQRLAKALEADVETVCGGTMLFGKDNKGKSLRVATCLMTNEKSGHFYEHWTDAIRQQFVKYMQLRTGLKVIHHEGM